MVGIQNTGDSGSITLITEYLLRTGERPVFFNMPFVNRNAIERQNAYRKTMQRHDAEPITMSPPRSNWDFEAAGFAAMKSALEGGGLPSKSILCANDRIAFGAMSAAYEHGLRIGRSPDCDLLIAGHDDHPLSRYTCPGLTTVAQDCVKMAEVSTDILLKRIAGDIPAKASPETVRLEAKLVMRASA